LIRPWLGFALTGILCALSLPLIALSMLIAGAFTTMAALGSPFRARQRNRDSDFEKKWQSDEFAFERAIEAYEELIDAHAWRRS
jgi:CHASE1-domain containing sensor protein